MIETTSETSNQETSPYVEIGATLREAREQAGLDQAAITRSLHLPGSVIEDIEQGRVERLSSIYRRGYIANYAHLLGLDAQQLLAEAQLDEPPQLQQALPVSQPGWKFEKYLRIATYVLVTTVIVPPLLYFFVQGGSRIMERDPVSAEQSETTELHDGASERTGRSRLARAISPDEVETGQDKSEPRHVSASALPLTAAVRPIRESASQEIDSAFEISDTEIDSTGDVASDGLIDLAIEVKEDSWVEIQAADGQRLEYDLLRAGQSRSYRGAAPFQLLLGRASAVEVRLDGQLVAYEGHDRGDVARFALLASGEVER